MDRDEELRAIESAIAAGKIKRLPYDPPPERPTFIASKEYGRRMGKLRRGKR